MSRADEFAYPAVGLEFDSGGTLRLPVAHQGLTIREHFAAMAMQGILASEPDEQRWNPATLANMAAERADALIAELSK